MNPFCATLPLLLLTFLISPSISWARGSSTGNHASSVRRSDPEIEQILRAKLAKSKVGKDGFQFHVKNGLVTWQGSTDVMQHKGAATRMAKTAGATQVINNIKISDGAKQKAAGNLQGGVRKAQVKME